MSSEQYAIKDLEKLSGIKAHTIRIWEQRFGIFKPQRTANNIRRYSNEDLRQLLNISLLNQHGFKISAICQMSEAEIVKQVKAIGLADVKAGMEEQLLLSLIEIDERKFKATFAKMIAAEGFEGTMIKFIFPFFYRIGIMWQAGTISSAQEHFFSNLIRNKIIAATEALPDNDEHRPKALLFLPEQELHELGLLFYNYALRARGYNTLYLGQSVPNDSLSKVISSCSPQFVVTGITSSLTPLSFANFATKLSHLAPFAQIYFTGPIPEACAGQHFPVNVLFIDDFLSLLGIKR